MFLTNEFEKFDQLVKNQFEYGGKKYAGNKENPQRESTDDLFDKHGKNWLFGTMDKYIYRYRNVGRERDILKIATYCYILWLKKGFFVKSEGLTHDILDTNVEMKSRYFQDFQSKMRTTIEYWSAPERNLAAQFYNGDLTKKLNFVSSVFSGWSKEAWDKLTEWSIVSVYYTMFVIWLEFYSKNEKHDEDVNHQNDTK